MSRVVWPRIRWIGVNIRRQQRVGTMANNPWVAIDPTTSPSLRANELRQIGHDYLGAGRAARVWQSIAESWRLSKVAGIDLSSSRAPTMLADPRAAPSRPGRLGRSRFRPT